MTDEINHKEKAEKPPKTGGKWAFWIGGLICLALSFYIPYNIVYEKASHPWSPGVKTREEPAPRTIEIATREAVRSGIIGVSVALLILLMWKVDRLLFARKDRESMSSIWVKCVISLLAFVLWVVWTSSGHIMLKANDEITESRDNVNPL